jgi:hypothetical protein
MGAMPAGPVLRPWRKFLRFSVRGMIVLVLVVGVWLGWMVRGARIQREVVAAIQNAGGTVHYNGEKRAPWDGPDEFTIYGARPIAPPWLIDLVGIDYFCHVSAVKLYRPRMATNADLSRIACRTQLQELYISRTSLIHTYRTRITDAGILGLKRGLPRLMVANRLIRFGHQH